MEHRQFSKHMHGVSRLAWRLAVLLAATLSSAAAWPQATHGAPSEFLDATRPWRNGTPIVAVLASNEGTETTDFLLPYAILQRANAATVVAVAPATGPAMLMPALHAVLIDQDLASFDRSYPQGADYVVVPAMHRDDDPQILTWLRAQAAHGAVLVGICSGARVLAQAGLLDQRRFTGHWWDRGDLLKKARGGSHWPDARYAADGRIVTTTGVSASLPVSLALVERMAGAKKAQEIAQELGLDNWGTTHFSAQFRLRATTLWAVARDALAFWAHETWRVPVRTGDDDVGLALVADAWSRSYRSQSFTVADSLEPIRLRSGLRLVPEFAKGTEPAAPNMPFPTGTPTAQLNHSLCSIGARYGPGTRDWVALIMEYQVDLTSLCSNLVPQEPVSKP